MTQRINSFWARFARVSTGRFVPEVDGLRFLAIGAVLAVHVLIYTRERLAVATGSRPAYTGLGRLVAHGEFGVLLFFVLSGFILAVPFAEHRLAGGSAPRLGRYYLRRLTRLEPPYIVAMCLLAALLVIRGKLAAGEALEHLGVSLVYLHELVYGRESIVNFVAWSLEVEVQFYLVAPAIGLVFAFRRRLVRRALFVALAVLPPVLLPAALLRPHGSILTYAQYFLTGFLLADLYIADWRRAPSRRWIFEALGVVAVVLIGALLVLECSPIGRTPYALVFPALIFVAYVDAFRGPLANRVVRLVPVVAIGGMCYTIYLYHMVLVSVVGTATSRLITPSLGLNANALVQFVLVAPVVVAVSGALFLALEKPFMRPDWHRTLFGRRKENSAPRAETLSFQMDEGR